MKPRLPARIAGASAVDRLEPAAVDAELDEVVLVENADHQTERLMEVRAGCARLAWVEQGRREDGGHDARFAVLRELAVLETRLPGDELTLGEVVVLVEPVGELPEGPLAGLGGIVASRPVRQMKDREVPFGSVRAHDASNRVFGRTHRRGVRQNRT